MNELIEFKNANDLSASDIAVLLGVNTTSVNRWLTGHSIVPEGVYDDLHQIEADIDYVLSFIKAHPELRHISYKIWKIALNRTLERVRNAGLTVNNRPASPNHF